MANAFSNGRLGLWHTDLASFLPNYDAYRKLGVTDIFFKADDPHLTTTLIGEVKTKLSGDGKNFRPQLAVDGTHGQDGLALYRFTLAAVTKFRPGVAEINIEGADDATVGQTVATIQAAFRDNTDWRANFPLCFNVAPMKGYVLQLDRLAADPFAYVRVQRFYGAEMRPAEPTLVREDIVGRGFPAERFSFMESAKARRLVDGSLFVDLPIFADGGVKVRNLSAGAIFNANLLREAGLI